MRRAVVALLNTAVLVFLGLALGAALCGAYLVWDLPGLAWAAVPCAVIAAGVCWWLGMLAEGVAAGEERRR